MNEESKSLQKQPGCFLLTTLGVISLIIGGIQYTKASARQSGHEQGFKEGQQAIEKVLYIGDIDQDGHKDIAAVFKNKEDGKTYKILYGDKDGKFVIKTEGLGKDGNPLDYNAIEKIAIKYAKGIDQPKPQEEIKKTIVDKLMKEKYEKK